MDIFELANMNVEELWRQVLDGLYCNPSEVKYAINADGLLQFFWDECYREIMVSYIPMLPLLTKTVMVEEADYILYANPFARCQDVSQRVLEELRFINEKRKKGAEIIVLGKSANAEKLLNGEIKNITFWLDHYVEKLGKKFHLDIKDQYIVYDSLNKQLSLWPVDGCMKKCNFCREAYMDIKFESLPIEQIKKTLDLVKERRPEWLRHIDLRAENITEYGLDIYGKQRLQDIIRLVDSYEEVKNISFSIGMCIGEITQEILEAICESKKVRNVYMNIEAGTDRLLNTIGKGHTCKDVLDIFLKIRKAHPDVEFVTVVMLGLPTETISDVYDLADLIVKATIDEVKVNFYVDAPRLPLHQYPQLSKGLREYHLKLFLKRCEEGNKTRDLTVKCWYLPNGPKKRKSRSEARRKMSLMKMNERALFPFHNEVEIKLKNN